jgi:hypothetical protein
MRQEHTTISTDQSGGNGATSTKVGIGTIWYYTHRVRESAESTDSSPGARVIECRLASVSSTAVPYTVDATDLLRIGGAGRGAQIARTEPTPDRPRRTGMADTSHDSADMPLYAPLCTGLYLRFTTSVRCPSPRALYTYRSAAPCAVPAYMYMARDPESGSATVQRSPVPGRRRRRCGIGLGGCESGHCGERGARHTTAGEHLSPYLHAPAGGDV